VENHIGPTLFNGTFHVVAVPDVAMYVRQRPFFAKPGEILSRTISGKVVEDDKLLASPQCLRGKVAPKKSTSTGY
jgi:hypothetical protein